MRYFVLLLCLSVSSINALLAQTVKIYLKDGDTKTFEVTQIDSIVCSNETVGDVSVGPTIEDVSANILRDIDTYIGSIYLDLTKFETGQLYLEALRTNKLEGDIVGYEDISPNCMVIKETWDAGYSTINKCNMLMSKLQEGTSTDDYRKYIKELITIRAFVYYNMTQLWGSIPFITENNFDLFNLKISEQSDILADICKDLYEVIDDGLESKVDNEQFRLGKDAAIVLLAEVEMLRGNKAQANRVLQKMTTSSTIFELNLNNVSNEYIFWGYRNQMLGNRMSVCIFSSLMVDLLQQENDGSTEPLVDSWDEYCSNCHFVYGYWTALKRLGEAEKVANIPSYMLLMPIPFDEILLTPGLTQNPGWGTR